MHLGDVPAGIVLYIPFATYDGATGASETCSGLAVTDVEIYKNGSVTQRASDAGYTLLDTDGIDFDALTGINGFSVDLNDNTDAGFFSVGGFYWVVVSSITADAVTVNFIAATFRIVTAEAIAGKPKVDVDAWLGTAAATPTVAGVPEVDITHIGGSAVSTSSAQLGVNVVNAAGTAWNSGSIGASTLASDTIAAAKIAAGAITAAKFAAGAIDATAIADGAIDAATFASGAINAAAIATDAIGAAELAADAATEIADAILARDIGSGSGAGSLDERTVRSALRFLRNKWSISGTTITVTKEDDATSAWTSALTATPGANPITASDPA
jgi:hypothetical protein